jgi:hypothetical protein
LFQLKEAVHRKQEKKAQDLWDPYRDGVKKSKHSFKRPPNEKLPGDGCFGRGFDFFMESGSQSSKQGSQEAGAFSPASCLPLKCERPTGNLSILTSQQMTPKAKGQNRQAFLLGITSKLRILSPFVEKIPHESITDFSKLKGEQEDVGWLAN